MIEELDEITIDMLYMSRLVHLINNCTYVGKKSNTLDMFFFFFFSIISYVDFSCKSAISLGIEYQFRSSFICNAFLKSKSFFLLEYLFQV